MPVPNNNNNNNNHNRRRRRRTTTMTTKSLPASSTSSLLSLLSSSLLSLPKKQQQQQQQQFILSVLFLLCAVTNFAVVEGLLQQPTTSLLPGGLQHLSSTLKHNTNNNNNKHQPHQSGRSSYSDCRSSYSSYSRSKIIQRNVLKTDDDETEKANINNILPPSSPPPPPPPSTGTATTGVWRPKSFISSTQQVATTTETTQTQTTGTRTVTSQRDVMISRAAKLRQSIVRQQDELMTLERQIQCCSSDGSLSSDNNNNNNGNGIFPISGLPTIKELSPINVASKLINTFKASSNVLIRKIDRVQKKSGKNNQKWNNVGEYAIHELFAGIRIATTLIKSPLQIQQIVIDPQSPTLVAHLPSILTRLDKLEIHVSPILERVLNNRQHLASIEPYLDEILERFDDIEPHLEWILNNIDALAPYTGLLLKHVDALLLFANCDDLNDIEQNKQQQKQKRGNGDVNCCDSSTTKSAYSLADQLLPYLEYYISKLDVIGPHLVLLRPHVPLLLKYNRIAKVSPHIDKLFARGYETRLTASANIDVLLFWFGWTLRIPFAPQLFFALPFSPRLVSFLCNRLPKKFARKGKSYCRNLECAIDDNYGVSWNKLDKA